MAKPNQFQPPKPLNLRTTTVETKSVIIDTMISVSLSLEECLPKSKKYPNKGEIGFEFIPTNHSSHTQKIHNTQTTQGSQTHPRNTRKFNKTQLFWNPNPSSTKPRNRKPPPPTPIQKKKKSNPRRKYQTKPPPSQTSNTVVKKTRFTADR